jgi:SAM-dependent methyltransferase
MTQNTSYYLGNDDKEIARLALQHAVWRPTLLATLEAAGLARGRRVLDCGAGPGFVSLDMAEIVGPQGKITALERSAHYVAALTRTIDEKGLPGITPLQADIEQDPLPESEYDFIFVRWVFAFLGNPIAALAKLTRALKPGGRMIVFEYYDWGAMQFMPDDPRLTSVKEIMIADWRKIGEIDAAKLILPAITNHGLHLVSLNPHFCVITPTDFAWQWPKAFLLPHAQTLASRKALTRKQADGFESAYKALEGTPEARMTTPLVAEIILEKTKP